MYSLDIDYLFNRVYDVLLWIKYVFLFGLLRKDPKEYLAEHEDRSWDGLRDRGWLDYANDSATLQPVDANMGFFEKIAHKIGYKLPDSDGDGVPDVSDPSPYDIYNLTDAQLKERYEQDYTFGDKLRNFFGINPKDSDGDGVPDSYEKAHNLNPKSIDSDNDGLSDGQEFSLGTDPLNNDTDSDTIIDGRDEAPLDPSVSSRGTDTDGDGVSDGIEVFLKTDTTVKDTDLDGIPDGMDTFPLDPSNVGGVSSIDIPNLDPGISFSIQNSILGFVADLYSVFAVFVLIGLAYVILRWLQVYLGMISHHEHEYEERQKQKTKAAPTLHAGITNLPVLEETITPPTVQEFEKHPRWAIVEGYMSSEQEALWRIGILEADNMLADALREKGYPGADVGEMLQAADFRAIQLAWDAHKVRNRIAHEGSQFTLTDREAKRVFALYEAVFREMKLI
jgi:hypothetical protein